MPVHFLNSPVGVACLIIIGLVSLINIYAHWVEDGLFGRLLYMATVITCTAGVVRYTDNTVPYHIATTLIFLFMLKSVRNISVKSVRYFKYRRTIHAKHKQ